MLSISKKGDRELRTMMIHGPAPPSAELTGEMMR